MIVTSSKATGKLRAYGLHGLTPNSVGNVPQTAFKFQEIPEHHCTFLSDNFIKMIYINAKD